VDLRFVGAGAGAGVGEGVVTGVVDAAVGTNSLQFVLKPISRKHYRKSNNSFNHKILIQIPGKISSVASIVR
jgi:hypothetical protein